MGEMSQVGRILLTRRAAKQLAEERDADLVRGCLDTLVDLSEGRTTPGDNPEIILRDPTVVISVRVNREQRLFCSLSGAPPAREVRVWCLGRQHDAGYRALRRLGVWALDPGSQDWQQVEQAISASQVPVGERFYELGGDSDPDDLPDFYARLDQHLALDPHQRELRADLKSNFVISGGPGTGKTVLAIYRATDLLRHDLVDEVLFLTFNQALRTVCRVHIRKCLGRDYLARLWLPDIAEFVTCSFEDPGDEELSQGESQELLETLLLSDEQLFDCLSDVPAADLWRNVRGLAVERDSEEQVRKQAKLHGQHMIRAWAELARRYQESKGDRLDWCDKLRALMVGTDTLGRLKQRVGLIVDEIQDFTVLEWKLVLEWHRHCGASVPFLITGDQGQQISHFGFAWDDLEGYLAEVGIEVRREHLVQIHRTGSLVDRSAAVFRKRLKGQVDQAMPASLPGHRPLLACISDRGEFWSALRETGGQWIKNVPIITSDAQAAAPDDVPCLVLSVADSKGLEFDQVILLGMFREDRLESQTDLQTYHMLCTRARTRFLAVLDTRAYRRLKGGPGPEWAGEFLETVDDVYDLKSALSQLQAHAQEELSLEVAVHLGLARARGFARRFEETGEIRQILDAARVYQEMEELSLAAECYLAAFEGSSSGERDEHLSQAAALYRDCGPRGGIAKLEQLLDGSPAEVLRRAETAVRLELELGGSNQEWLARRFESLAQEVVHPEGDRDRLLGHAQNCWETAARLAVDFEDRIQLLDEASGCASGAEARRLDAALAGAWRERLSLLSSFPMAQRLEYLERAILAFERTGASEAAMMARLKLQALSKPSGPSRAAYWK